MLRSLWGGTIYKRFLWTFEIKVTEAETATASLEPRLCRDLCDDGLRGCVYGWKLKEHKALFPAENSVQVLCVVWYLIWSRMFMQHRCVFQTVHVCGTRPRGKFITAVHSERCSPTVQWRVISTEGEERWARGGGGSGGHRGKRGGGVKGG